MENEALRVAAGDSTRVDPGAEISRMGRFFSDLYDLELDLDGRDFLISPGLARSLLPGPSPRTGVLVIEQTEQLELGVYLDPGDCEDPFVLVEEASHLVCLSWHAAHDLPVSCLILELQSEIDRFLYFCHHSGHLSFSCFAPGRVVEEGIDEPARERYEIARERAHRYCRRLARRFAGRRDTVGLARELRRFYRASPATKLAA